MKSGTESTNEGLTNFLFGEPKQAAIVGIVGIRL
jgi:hypothetical protein